MTNVHQRGLLSDFAGVIVIILLTFLLHAAFFIPRAICVMQGMMMFWNQAHSPDLIADTLYEGVDFLFALLAGILSMAAVRLFAPSGRRAIIILSAATIIFLYSLLTIFLHGKLPQFFSPVYLDLSAAIPGWLIGYYLAGGREIWENFGPAKIAFVTAPACIAVAALVITPWYMPFYAEVQHPVLVSPTFSQVPQPQNPGAYVPQQSSSNDPDQIPSFHPVPTNGQ